MIDLPVIQKSVDAAGHLTFVCIGALVCTVFAWALQIKTAGVVKSIWLSLTEILLAEALGLLFAKGIFFLVRFNYLIRLSVCCIHDAHRVLNRYSFTISFRKIHEKSH